MASHSPVVEFLLKRNRDQSEAFCSPDATLWRRQYRARHPTEIAALKCMDGRLNLSVLTQTPPGIIQPFRNIGGKFDMGWPYFGALINSWVEYSTSRGRDCLILVTYHWSKGEVHRGCRGFDYNAESARNYTVKLKQQIETVFGMTHHVVYPIQVGIETDEDALVLHGNTGLFDLANEVDLSMDDIRSRVKRLYPDMHEQMVQDLLPLLRGNVQHIQEIRTSGRPITEAEHKERILAIGRGFDWLHLPNQALIIGPYSYNLGEPIAGAARILLSNLEEGRTPKAQGAVLMTSAAFRDEVGAERTIAAEKAKSLAEFAMVTIKEHVPELLPHLTALTGVLNLQTRLFTPL